MDPFKQPPKLPIVRDVFQNKLGLAGHRWVYRTSDGRTEPMPRTDFLKPFDEDAAARNRV